jgi:hypothetical protein
MVEKKSDSRLLSDALTLPSTSNVKRLSDLGVPDDPVATVDDESLKLSCELLMDSRELCVFAFPEAVDECTALSRLRFSSTTPSHGM